MQNKSVKALRGKNTLNRAPVLERVTHARAIPLYTLFSLVDRGNSLFRRRKLALLPLRCEVAKPEPSTQSLNLNRSTVGRSVATGIKEVDGGFTGALIKLPSRDFLG